jgi:dTDP-3,4-didehydro-2,6-dideoxy-alpha-D-glucose 3-reductase
MPALNGLHGFRFAGVAIADQSEWPSASEATLKAEREKANEFINGFGGRIFDGYRSIIQADNIDALYIPLPPSLHFHWAKQALAAGKHVLIEKPATTSFSNTKELIDLAAAQNLALHENYMFAFHQQLAAIDNIVKAGEMGDVRLYRVSFGFPRRAAGDFRYNKALGGGALLDAGGYTIKYASMLLGDTAKLVYAQSQFTDEFEVDIAGSAALVNENGVTAQIAFGMDNSYKCDLEVWGSNGTLQTGRILTAPAGFIPEVTIKTANKTEIRKLPEDDAFSKSILHFRKCIEDEQIRKNNYVEISRQAKFVQQFHYLSKT